MSLGSDTVVQLKEVPSEVADGKEATVTVQGWSTKDSLAVKLKGKGGFVREFHDSYNEMDVHPDSSTGHFEKTISFNPSEHSDGGTARVYAILDGQDSKKHEIGISEPEPKDPDGDGLLDDDPCPDTPNCDGDGWNDKEDPRPENANTDGEWRNDGEPDEGKVDVDNDGRQNFEDPDNDGDGDDDGVEANEGTDPNDPNSYPRGEPDPAIRAISVDPQNQVPRGEAVTVEVTVTNQGGAADWQSIAVSLPNVKDEDSVEVIDHDLSRVRVAPEGTEIGTRYGQGKDTAEHPLIEADVRGWENGETHRLKLRVTPERTGEFVVHVKSVANQDDTWWQSP